MAESNSIRKENNSSHSQEYHRHHASHHHHHSGYSHREPKQSNMAIEVAKERKKTIWLRSIFLSAFIIAIVILVVTTIKMGNSDEQGTSFRLFNHDKENAKQMQMELDELKKENIELKYELEKYKDKYGELDMQE